MTHCSKTTFVEAHTQCMGFKSRLSSWTVRNVLECIFHLETASYRWGSSLTKFLDVAPSFLKLPIETYHVILPSTPTFVGGQKHPLKRTLLGHAPIFLYVPIPTARPFSPGPTFYWRWSTDSPPKQKYSLLLRLMPALDPLYHSAAARSHVTRWV
jgi:hypothetical protein